MAPHRWQSLCFVCERCPCTKRAAVDHVVPRVPREQCDDKGEARLAPRHSVLVKSGEEPVCSSPLFGGKLAQTSGCLLAEGEVEGEPTVTGGAREQMPAKEESLYPALDSGAVEVTDQADQNGRRHNGLGEGEKCVTDVPAGEE